MVGFLCAFLGALVLVAPHRFAIPGVLAPYRGEWGAAALLSGVALVAVTVVRPRRAASLLPQVLAGGALLALAVSLASARLWVPAGIYAALGAGTAFLGPLTARPFAASLQARFALILAIATSLALILATALVTAHEERLAGDQALATQRIEARAIARNVADYIEMNGARTFAVAVLAGRTPMDFWSQRRLLAGSRRSYPDVTAFRTVAPDGRIVAAAGNLPIDPRLLRTLAVDLRAMPSPRTQVKVVDSSLLLAAPIHGAEGEVAGMLVAAFDAEALARRIARPGSSVSLADGHGKLIASRDEATEGETGALPADWDRRIRAGRRVARPDSVDGFAVVHGLGWVVAVERPRADALAAVREGRDLAFGLLLLIIPLAIVGGIVVARRIARPLGDLSEAVDELTAGNPAAPIGADSGVAEVDRLAATFREMRDRLAERTSESERLAAELRIRADRLAEVDRRKDEFLAMLAHELRNPLGAIANASYLLEQLKLADPQAASDAQSSRAVAIIRRQIQHLVRLVDDLLDVSRITRGKVELRRERLDLGEAVRHVVETMRLPAEEKKQTLRAEVTSEPLPLYGDATRLEQVLSNLLRNAVKFTGHGGTIEVSARRDGGHEAVVTVRDDGIGIAPELLPRVFDLFAQGDQALDRSGAGLGIGLTLVRRLVAMHGGRVEARSEGHGKGCEFEVRLPLA